MKFIKMLSCGRIAILKMQGENIHLKLWSIGLKCIISSILILFSFDPMHCLFLGIAKWIIKLWINEGILTPPNLALMENRAKNMQIPVDIGRIPYKIATVEGFSRFTAD